MSTLTQVYTTAQALENCAKEAVHQTPLIQSHGFLLACDAQTGNIGFASANALAFVMTHRTTLLDTALSELLLDTPEAALTVLRAVPSGAPTAIGLRFRSSGAATAHFEVMAHRTGPWVVIEAMPYRRGNTQLDDQVQLEGVVLGLSTLHHHKNIPSFLQACAHEIRKVAQYQRVIIYRFLPDWSGEVIAESADEGIASRFLGLRFPASDIPVQARALYRANLLRIIGDVDAQPVALESSHPDGVLDQTHTLLRSPSPLHLGYLRNMGVRATMTISLLKDGELWGMVSCHHDQPKTPPAQLRRTTQLLCAVVAEMSVLRIDSVVRQETAQRHVQMHEALVQLTSRLCCTEDFDVTVRAALKVLGTTLNFQTYGLLLEGQWVITPEVPQSLLNLLHLLAQDLSDQESYFTHHLAHDAPQSAATWEPWAGAAIVKLPELGNSVLFLLREAIVGQVHWAGAPSTAQTSLPSGMVVLGPRQSFERWTQLVHGQSDVWSELEQSSCCNVAQALSAAHRQHKHQVMQSELHMLGSCMAHLNDMVVVTDTARLDEPGPQIVYVNEAFIQSTGYSRDEVLGRSPRFLQGAQTQRPALDAIREAMTAWRPVTVELINYKKGGEPYWAEISLTPIADNTGWYTHWIAIQRNVDERKRAETVIQKLANYDSLTGLPNRNLLMERLHLALSNSQRYARNVALILVDLDHFKELNDTAGHLVGDELLRQVAQRLNAEVRQQDMVARLGGDEFLVIVEGLSSQHDGAAAETQVVAEKLIHCLHAEFNLVGYRHNCTASLGITLIMDCNGETAVEDLLKQVDFAMYQAKAAGRNSWRFYDPQTQAALLKRNALEAELKQAFAAQQLVLHYQPIFDGDQRMTGVEALLRWPHASIGWVSPTEFVPIAEQGGLIIPIGLWVLETACQVLAKWARTPRHAHWTMAVNVSAAQTRQPDFVDQILATIARSGCNPHQLKLELTESLLQHDIEESITKMTQLRAIGIQFSIDDFGTGYSSLTYLRRLPISVLKIDRSFVKSIEHNVDDQAICQTILALGRALNLSIVAEGVETMEQFSLLLQSGCDRFQGFLFSKALPLDVLEKTLT